MRLFVALTPSPAAIDHLAAAVAGVRARGAPVDLRWVAPDRWHLTLCFLGEVADARVPELRGRLARRAARATPMTLRFARVGRFGGRLLWCGLAGDLDQLGALASATAAAARRTGLEVEDRRYRPHLTLARARGPVDLRGLVDVLAGYDGPLWTADTLHLVRSRLGPDPSYDDVASWPLGRPGDPG